ncbi:methyl-accepting chemotaxis protein [Aneurinibacillus tyrosinisolvens]|uniref:methyl-accepting chemotaxis protein n=1 Tax=Aneurinibacillus tyrosinisolvens TaxID=1443435 RepID=UPI0009E1F6FB|nr:methyl-accepting chemotaxis protein [Aneurinibacillus tyrosinisolvens]
MMESVSCTSQRLSLPSIYPPNELVLYLYVPGIRKALGKSLSFHNSTGTYYFVSINNMVRSLRGLIQQIDFTIKQVAASSEQLTANAGESSKASEVIAHTIQEVAVGSERQVHSVGKSSKTVAEMSTSVQRIAMSSQNVTDAAIHALETALTGNQAIETAIKQMNSISRTTDSLAETVKGLGERSQEIEQIIEVITEISTQTNLLALNAAIEAARAGEHGRGFAIVADEVRKLAEQSGSSAQKIAQLIATIQKETNQAVQSMQTATKEVADGIETVNTAGASFGQIQQSVNEVDNQIKGISTAVQQVVTGTEQMVHSIDIVTRVAEEAAAGTQNVSAAAEEQLASMQEITASSSSLSQMADELQTLVKKFKV